VKILTQLIGVASISGIVRLVRRGIGVDYALFAALSAAMLVVWHFPPNERFILPMFPLLAAGLVTEFEHLFAGLRKGFKDRDGGQRAAAYLLASAAGIVVAAGIGLQLFVSFFYLNQLAEQDRAKLRDLRKAYAWIAGNVPADSKILSSDDPLLYAYTGRRGITLPLMPEWWYAEDHDRFVGVFRDAAAYCRGRGLDYFFSTSSDLDRWGRQEDQSKADAVLRADRQLEPVLSDSGGTLYRVSGENTKVATNEHH